MSHDTFAQPPEDVPPINEVKCLDLGFVALVDTMGTDRTPAQTARTSFRNRKERTAEEDAKLTDYLIRHSHTTPLEFCQVLVYAKMPISVARQWVRHRTASINEMSMRYVKALREYYVADEARMQKKSATSKQGSSDELIADPALAQKIWRASCESSFDAYEALVEMGLAPELARNVLPVCTYTEWYWQCDLHNTLHFFSKRLPPDAQYETRVYAKAMLDLLRPVYPTIISSWARVNGYEL